MLFMLIPASPAIKIQRPQLLKIAFPGNFASQTLLTFFFF